MCLQHAAVHVHKEQESEEGEEANEKTKDKSVQKEIGRCSD